MNNKPIISLGDTVIVMDDDGTVWWQGRGGRTWLNQESTMDALEFFALAVKRQAQVKELRKHNE